MAHKKISVWKRRLYVTDQRHQKYDRHHNTRDYEDLNALHSALSDYLRFYFAHQDDVESSSCYENILGSATISAMPIREIEILKPSIITTKI